MSQRELLIRLDERVRTLVTQVTVIQASLIPKDEYKELSSKVSNNDQRLDKLERYKERIVGYFTIAGALGGIIASVISSYIKDLLKL